jgi:hypothetical protein
VEKIEEEGKRREDDGSEFFRMDDSCTLNNDDSDDGDDLETMRSLTLSETKDQEEATKHVGEDERLDTWK